MLLVKLDSGSTMHIIVNHTWQSISLYNVFNSGLLRPIKRIKYKVSRLSRLLQHTKRKLFKKAVFACKNDQSQ